MLVSVFVPLFFRKSVPAPLREQLTRVELMDEGELGVPAAVRTVVALPTRAIRSLPESQSIPPRGRYAIPGTAFYSDEEEGKY